MIWQILAVHLVPEPRARPQDLIGRAAAAAARAKPID